ncbi:MarR family winged helix-turn-helix transcriptional regulator [Tellurirhabdus rosea]|uniref:MarR family winged helix-turn-helix transcriptional regulator n=1 Tax=Tellurirhabdus rosea TaxID=2674997 RepID=UPI00224E929B|nr:MarR family winged helix-turn-helix transcriptional regulator [Tellurirhabdus rosea]
MNYRLLKEILEQLEVYEKEKGESGPALDDFARWLLGHSAPEAVRDDPSQAPQKRWEAQMTAPEKDIGMYVVYLNRYARHYTKKALDGSPLTTMDDFSYLAKLMATESLTKTELIQVHKQEKTSGIEVIKRLLGAGLIEQFDDPQDRRSKRVRLTAKGRQTIYGVFEPMLAVSQLVAGNLTESEKRTLVDLLRKLNHFHEPLFLDHHDASLDALKEFVKKS